MYRHRVRHLNSLILEMFSSAYSQRRMARTLKVNRKTIVRKFVFLALRARERNLIYFSQLPKIHELQFDDLETFEHTKLKPLSVTLAVEKNSRKIIGFEVSSMPAKGHLALKSVKKYGRRADQRTQAREDLFAKIKVKVSRLATIESDSNPHYVGDVKRHFPDAYHKTYLGGRSAIVGQGELKKLTFDPLFSLNHTCAMLRANINRLIRKTWCTTKKSENLARHLEIYAYFHNHMLLDQ